MLLRFRSCLVASFLAALLVVPLRAVEPVQICAGLPALGVPDWMRHEIIYEVNVRQYSDAGTFAAVEADLPRLRELGVGVLWFMPIHPIGEKNRKGTLGSYYAIRDYAAINPEFGTEDDFRRLVKSAHDQGFRIILDWVGNHTAWDNPLATSHPEYFLRDASGHFQPPTGFDWTDVIQLDFTHPGVLAYQFETMARWVREFGIDGFRCDYATGVPTPFWDELSRRLREVRPDLYLLSESELPQHQLRAFNTSYSFEMMHTFNHVAAGEAPLSAIDATLARTRVRFPEGGSLIYYTSNHDENSWQGTEMERLGVTADAFAVLTFVLDGIPLIYNGQEIALNRRLEFFERDPIQWTAGGEKMEFYRNLCALKRSHPALAVGAPQRRILTTKDESIYALFRGADEGAAVVTFLNLTKENAHADAYDPALAGRWRDLFTGEVVDIVRTFPVELEAGAYRVLVRAEPHP